MSAWHPVIRVSDMLAPEVGPDRVRAVLAARGVPVGDRDTTLPPAGSAGATRALLTTTAAGVVVTFESRTGRFAPRGVVLRRLTRDWDLLVRDLEDDARGRHTTGQNRTDLHQDAS